MTTTREEWDADTLRALPGYPWLPCPICKGVEGCDHVVPERARAALPGLILSLQSEPSKPSDNHPDNRRTTALENGGIPPPHSAGIQK